MMVAWWKGFWALLLALAWVALWDRLPRRDAPDPVREDVVSARGLLGNADSGGFARALAPRPFVFPGDHAAHPDYRHEWWYLTGNLQDAAGRRFGYQFTVFRFALQPEESRGASAWRTRQLYLGHMAVTDIASDRFHHFQRFARGALGLAGTGLDPLRVWVEDWALRADRTGTRWHVTAAEDDIALDLRLVPDKPVVLQGERGLRRKGSEPGNASYYYSLTRLATEGRLTLAGKEYTVTGLSWMDREWGTSALGADVVGWDWFALQLEDGRDLMLYHLRRADGTPARHSGGVLVAGDGSAVPMALGPQSVIVTGAWTSPRTGIEYPAGWRLRLPEPGLELIVKPQVAAQEWDAAIRYWEGAVVVHGQGPGGEIRGSGYVELTGYGDDDKRTDSQ